MTLIRDGGVTEFIERHNGNLDNNGAEPILWHGDLIPGTTYVSYQCIYMNPLSSYFAFGGDSGCKYIVGEDYFATINRNDGAVTSVEGLLDLDTADSGLQNMVDVPKWEWQEFPYTDEEWAALYVPEGFGMQNISEIYDEILYQPLTAGKFLLRVDGDLWLVELNSNEQMGTYLWSIYSLVPEYDLREGELKIPAEDIGSFVFFTNSTQISVAVQKDASFDGSITLLDISQGNAEIQYAKVSGDDNGAFFTGLTASRRYRLSCEGLEGCTLVISG